ncbi:MAG: metallophosphoesterase [Chloroflexota bacterium]
MNKIDVNSKLKHRFSRRDFLKFSASSALGILVAAAGVDYMIKNKFDAWEVVQIQLVLPGLPASFSGMRLVQISDIHLGGWMNIQRLKSVLDIVQKIAPNVIAITGDFVIWSRWAETKDSELDEMESELGSLARQIPILAVLGNHDHWADASVVTKMLTRAGVRTLNNDVESFQINGEFLYFGGVDDVLVESNRLDQVLAKLPEKSCAILLAHEPDFAVESAETGRFELQISGHSHGGQVNLPGVGPPVLPQWGKKFPSGLYKVGNMVQYTNRGVGMTRPYIRVNCPPEITVFTLFSP